METLKKTFVFSDSNPLSIAPVQDFLTFDVKDSEFPSVVCPFSCQGDSTVEEKESTYLSNSMSIEEEHDKALNFFVEVRPYVERSQVVNVAYQLKESSEDSLKKQRSKERTVLEVLMGVKRWRELSNPKSPWEKKLTLQEAAKELGFNKKTLDDYYSYLRLAESLGFDFSNNLHSGIGILRNYVKTNRKLKKMARRKNQRLPRELSILESMDFSNLVIMLPTNASEIDSEECSGSAQQNLEELRNLKLSSDPWMIDQFICLGAQSEMKPFPLDFLDLE